MKRDRVLVLGIDGGDLDLFRRLGMGVVDLLEARGRLGSLQRVWREDRGWAMILCGKDASFTGGYYWDQVPGTYWFKPQFRATDYVSEPLWTRLDAAGVRAGFVAVPTTFPPQPLRNGLFIAGGGGGQYPNLEDCVHPQSLLETDGDLFDGLVLDFRNQVGANLTPDTFIKGLLEETWTKERLVSELFDRYQLDFAMAVFVGADRIQHLLWPHLEAAIDSRSKDRYGILRYYQALDQTLIHLIERYSKDCHVVLCSDHGFAPRRFEVSVNQVLVQLGFQQPAFGARHSLIARAEARFKDRVSERIRKHYRRLRPWQGHSPPRLDWARTEAFVNTAAGVWVNTSDRFPKGSVSPSDRTEVVDRLLERLQDIRDPLTGRPLFSKLARREDVYAGPQRHRAPDLVFDLDDTYEVVNDLDPSIVRAFLPAPMFTGIIPRTMSGIHGSGGIFGAIGPNVHPTQGPVSGGYIDVHHVIVALLGLGSKGVMLADDRG